MGKESEIVGGSGTATRTQAIVSAAEQRFTMPAIRLREGASRILTLVLDQLQKNIPPGLESRVLGENNDPIFGENELTAQGISGQFDAYILEDAALGSVSVERELAVFIYNLLLQNPIVATDPYKLYNETANLLKAFKQNPEEHLGVAPEQKDIDTPEEENTLMVQGQFNKVRAIMTENHMQHLIKHMELQRSPTLQMIPPDEAKIIIQYAQAHAQEHMMMMQQMMVITTKYGGKNGQAANPNASGLPGMEGNPEPFGKVQERKEQGTAEYSPAMQL
jgi:hypothetical protein